MARTVEMRDPYTAGHQQRVAELSLAIAEEMGLTSEETEGIYLGALIHDTGKICVPAEILAMPRRLTDIEMEMIRSHPENGYEILKEIDFSLACCQNCAGTSRKDGWFRVSKRASGRRYQS